MTLADRLHAIRVEIMRLSREYDTIAFGAPGDVATALVAMLILSKMLEEKVRGDLLKFARLRGEEHDGNEDGGWAIRDGNTDWRL